MHLRPHTHMHAHAQTCTHARTHAETTDGAELSEKTDQVPKMCLVGNKADIAEPQWQLTREHLQGYALPPSALRPPFTTTVSTPRPGPTSPTHTTHTSPRSPPCSRARWQFRQCSMCTAA